MKKMLNLCMGKIGESVHGKTAEAVHEGRDITEAVQGENS